MDNKEIVLFDRSIRVTSDWYVCVSDAQCAINESRNRVGLKRYNFSQWLKTLYVSDMVCSINESGKDAFKVEFDNDSGKIEQYCHFGVFVNMILSANPPSLYHQPVAEGIRQDYTSVLIRPETACSCSHPTRK